MTDTPLLEKVKRGAQQIETAVNPTGEAIVNGQTEFVQKIPQGEILNRARDNQPLTPVDVKYFLNQTEIELGALDNIPPTLRFNLEQGHKGAEKRRMQIREVLEKIGIGEERIGQENFSPDEIWDAVLYDTRQTNDKGQNKDNGLKLLDDDRGKRIKKNASKIVDKIGKEKADAINAMGRAVKAQEVDTLSINSNQLLFPEIDKPFQLHPKQKPSDTEIDVRAVLIVRKKLQRIGVVQAFLNQRAGGWAGQTEEPKPGDPQLPDQVSYNEDTKQIIVQGVPFSGDSEHLTVVEMLDVLEDGERMFHELKDQLLGGIQGRSGWIAEAILRRLNEVWTETADIKQKAVGEIKTWVSQLGRGHLVAEFLEIPDVGRILAWEDWYQRRDPLTDRPLPIDDLPTIEARVKEKASKLQIPTSKVDLALYLSRILQLGYWPGRVGYKHRVFAERYAFEDVGASIPIGFIPQEEEFLEKLPRADRIQFEAYFAELNALTVGHLTDFAAEHLHRVVDNAATEDILFRWEVGDAPIYRVPPDEIIMLLSQNQKIPHDELKKLFIESYLHREQFRWLFVWARMGGLYKGWEYRLGEKASEKQYLNPNRAEDRGVLIEWLQRSNSPAMTTMREAGINPAWINDEIIQELFTDENMERVNRLREKGGGKINLIDLLADMRQAESLPASNRARIKAIATALELVLRDKRTWGVDMGVNNDLLARPELPREIRQRGGFGSDEAGAMVVMEFTRSDIHNTWATWLEQLSRLRLRNEFPDLKALFAAVTTKFGDEPRWRTDSAAAPYLPIVTALGIKSKDMLAGYFLMGYEATAGGMVTSQLHLSDVLDQMRILYWHKPVIGAYRRIFGRENHLAWMEELKLRQRADLYNALDTRWEQLFQGRPDLNSILSHLIVGGDGKAMYVHCVSRIVGEGQPGEIILRNDPDYWINRYEHEARYLYFPASRMAAVGMESQAYQGQMNRDQAKKQIDSFVSAGFMRRWYNDEFEAIGLGDLFQVQFETYVDQNRTTTQRQIFPIDFMIDLRQQARGVSVEFAAANGFANPTQFWELAKTGQLSGHDAELWKDFREIMLKGWVINVDEPDSEMAQFYWEWREQALEMLHTTEEGLEKIPDGGIFRIGYKFLRKMGELPKGAISFLRSGGGWAEQYVSQHRGDFEKRLKEDPVREELARIEANYEKFLVEEVREELTRANEKGLFLGEKLHIRKSLEDYYRKGQITRETRDMLLTEVVTKSYRPGWKALGQPGWWINSGQSIYSFIWNMAGGIVENFAKFEVTKQLLFAQIERVLSASPAGYLAAALWSLGSIRDIIKVGAAVGKVTVIPEFIPLLGGLPIPLALITVWGIFVAIQGRAILISNGLRIINGLVRWANKGRGLTDSDALIERKESKEG